jgi:hypothetical protein
MRAMQRMRRASMVSLLAEVANDDKVARLSAAQQADYLRDVGAAGGSNRNGKALARRALRSDTGLDFTAVLIAEVKAMRQRFAAELAAVDDSGHAVSFYSLETTKAGIAALCALPDDELEEMSATDILQVANIVGVPCHHRIENVVDPMLYRVDALYPGTFLSLSDLLVHHVQSRGEVLRAPGFTDSEVRGVVPFFEDARLRDFLHAHAPKLLELTASVNVRRVLADIPLTQAYVFAAAVWKMVEVAAVAPSEGNARLLAGFARELHAAMRDAGSGRGHFDHLLDVVQGQHLAGRAKAGAAKAAEAPRSFYLANNGLTNLLDPLLQLCNVDAGAAGGLVNGAQTAQKHAYMIDAEQRRGVTAQVLRGLYNFEVYQVVRRLIKRGLLTEKDPDAVVRAYLHPLLGVDLARDATALQPLFEAEPDPRHIAHCGAHALDGAALDALAGKMYWVDYICLVPAALRGAGRADPVAFFADADEWPGRPTAAVNCAALGLAVADGETAADAYRRFKLCNIVQAFANPSKAQRVDDAEKRMRIADLGSAAAQRKLLAAYVAAQHANVYQGRAVDKKKREARAVVDILVAELAAAPTMPAFCALLQGGLRRGTCAVAIENASVLGFVDLRDRLLDTASGDGVPLRLEKLSVVVLGRHFPEDAAGSDDDAADVVPLGATDGEVVFNGGRVVTQGLAEVEAAFARCRAAARYAVLLRRFAAHRAHVYRGDAAFANRHTHSEDKPSYFARGYATLAAFRAAVGDAAFAEYEAEHAFCCGLAQLKGLCVSRKQRFALAQ